MEPFRSSGEHRALLSCSVTNGDDEIKLLAPEFIQRLRAVAGNVDIQFPHHLDGLPAHLCRVRPGGEHVKSVARLVANQPFGDLTPSRITSTNNQYSLLHHGCVSVTSPPSTVTRQASFGPVSRMLRA
jgi:hypothetical protein